MKKILSFILLGLMCSIGNVWAGVTILTLANQSTTDGTVTITVDGSTTNQSNVIFPAVAPETGFPTGTVTTSTSYVKLGSSSDLGAKLASGKKITFAGLSAGDVITVYWFATSTTKPTFNLSYASAANKGVLIESYSPESTPTTKTLYSFSFSALSSDDINHIENAYAESAKLAYLSENQSYCIYAIKIESGSTPEPGSDPVDPTITFNDGAYTVGGAALDLSTLFTSNSTGAVTYSVKTDGGTGAAIAGTSFTATAAGTAVVTASQVAVAGYNAKSVDANIVVSAAVVPEPAGDENVIFQWEKQGNTGITADLTDLSNATYGTLSVGTSIYGRMLASNAIDHNSKGYKLGNNDVCIEIQGTSAFEAGDIVTITGVCGGSGARAFAIAPESTSDAKADTALTNTQENTSDILEYIVEIKSAQAGSKIRVFRLAGKTMYLYSIKVVRPATGTKPSITAQPEDVRVLLNGSASFSVTAVAGAGGALSYQWYSCEDANKTNPVEIDGATSASYSPATSVVGDYFFYCVVSETGADNDATSSVAKLTVSTASSEVVLTKVLFSNGFNAFINAPVAEPEANGTIEAYYMQGESAPTISSVEVSEGATYAIAESVLTVTAEDGVTTGIYDITIGAVAPYEGGNRLFDGSEEWVKTGNTFSTESGKEGWKISKDVEEEDNRRISRGLCRVYFFLGANSSVILTNGGTARNINVYKNGVKLDAPTSTGNCVVAGDGENPFMLEIASNKTNGDGALKRFLVEDEQITLGAGGYSTYATDYKFTVSGAQVFKAAYNGSDAVVLTEVENAVVPAKAGIILKGVEGATVNLAYSSESASSFEGNELKPAVAAMEAPENAYVLATFEDGTKFNPCGANLEIPAHKAYMVINGQNAPSLRIIEAGNGATGINELEGAEKAVKFIENGKLYIQKDGVVYDATGAKVK